MQVSQAVLLVDEGRALGINGAELLRPLRVADIDRSVAREELAVASVTGRHNAVEHIDTAGNVLQQVDRRTDAHQVAGLVFGEDAIGKLDHLVHLLRGLPDGKATDGIPFSAERSHEFGSSRTQLGVDTALHDGEEALMIVVVWIGLIDALHTATQPVFGERQRLLRIVEVRIARATFVESHDDIRTDDTLDIHHTLGGEEVL